MNRDFALVSVTHERATDFRNLTAGAGNGKYKRRSAPGESCMNRFSDAGSTPAVSISSAVADVGLAHGRNDVYYSYRSKGIDPTSSTTTSIFDPRHKGGVNFLFLDGHVERVPFAKIPDQDESKGVYNCVFYQPWQRKVPAGW